MIPKIFHQIWLNGEMPNPHKYLRDHMLELHPDWEYKLWTEENRPHLFNEEVYAFFERYMFKSDILRYEVLLKYGGVYVDTDYLFLKNIDCLLDREYVIIRDKTTNYEYPVNNCLMGFISNHYILEYVVKKIPDSIRDYEYYKNKENERRAGLHTVGPIFLNRCLKELDPYFHSFDRKYFCPFIPKEMEEFQFKDFPEAYAIHLWNSVCGSERIGIHKKLPCYKRNETKYENYA